MRVILDANFLMIPGQFGVDIFSEMDRVLERGYEIVVPEPVVRELEGISEGGGGDAKAASVALQLIEEKGLERVHAEGNADEAILEMAGGDTVVGTQDRELKKRLRERGVTMLVLKNKNYLDVEGPVE